MLLSMTDLEATRQRHADETIVLTSGTFDILHPGHVRYLQRAREYGDVLIVMTGSDERVRTRKSADRPIMPVEDRTLMLLALKVVDYVIVDPTNENPGIGHPAYVELIDRLNPDIYATDDFDPRFVDIVDPSKQVTLSREPGGRFQSTSEILGHIRASSN